MDFVILKVNGQDLRNATHEQAIQAFRKAQEPILVEVARRDSNSSEHTAQNPGFPNLYKNATSDEKTDVSVQTEPSPEEATLAAMAAAACTAEDIRAALGFPLNDKQTPDNVYSSVVPGLLDIVELNAEEEAEEDDLEELEEEADECIFDVNQLFPVSLGGQYFPKLPIEYGGYEHQSCPCKDSTNEEYDQLAISKNPGLKTDFVVGTHSRVNSADMFRHPVMNNLKFMEVELVRKSSEEKFGLTLCYQNGEDEDDACDIYVGEIDPHGVASHGAELMVGDRIIKINGQLIRNRKQVVEQFGASHNNAVLLIARHVTVNDLHTETAYIPFSKDSTPLLLDRAAEECGKQKTKECSEFCPFKRTDQDSGTGRTTDESARTEESSEQEIELEQKGLGPGSKDVSIHPNHQPTCSFSEPNHELIHPTPLLPNGDVFSNYNPVDPIDQELVQLGRLMQSLAVHCRQLVQAKMTFRSGPVMVHSPINKQSEGTSMDSPNELSERHPCTGFSETDAVVSSASSSAKRTPGDSLSNTPRVPRMGTRGVELSTSVLQFQNEQRSLASSHLTRLESNHSTQDRIPDIQTIKVLETSDSPKPCLSYEQSIQMTDIYPEVPIDSRTPSGQTSAYCTGESMKSQTETSLGVGIRLWNPAITGLKTQPDDSSYRDTPFGDVVASLSDLGGSMLSLAATIPSIPQMYSTPNEVNLGSRMIAESLSPVSNWSIDGSSQSNQRGPGNLGASSLQSQSTPEGSREQLLASGASEVDSSCINRSRPSGTSNISSSDSLSVTENLSGTQHVPRKPCVRISHKVGNKISRPNPSLNRESESNQSSVNNNHVVKVLDRSPNRIQSHRRTKEPDKKHTPHRSSSQSQRKSADQLRSRENSAKRDQSHHLITQHHPFRSSCNSYEHNIDHSRETKHSSNPHFPISISQAANSARPAVFPPRQQYIYPHIRVPFSAPLITCVRPTTCFPHPTCSVVGPLSSAEQVGHAYEFYDRFGLPQWTVPNYREPTPNVFNISDNYEKPRTSMANQATNSCKQVDDTAASDIYETPYASVTVNDEPIEGPTHALGNRNDGVQANTGCEKNNSDSHGLRTAQFAPMTTSVPPMGNFKELSNYASLFTAFNQLASSSYPFYFPCSQVPPIYSSAPYRNVPVPNEFGMSVEGQSPFIAEPLNVMEWVVKKRPDGSRYITRRPIRNRLLKERAKRVAEERCGLTTDDDAASELKTGRYINRIERRKQLDKSKVDRKKRQPCPSHQVTSCLRMEDSQPMQTKRTTRQPNGLVNKTSV